MIKYVAVKMKTVKASQCFTKMEEFFTGKPHVSLQQSFLKNLFYIKTLASQGCDLCDWRHHFQDWIARILKQNTADGNLSCSQENYDQELSNTHIFLLQS